MGKPEIIDLVTPNGTPVKCISIKLRPEQDMHDIEPIAKSVAHQIGMGRVNVLDYMWSDKAQAWAVFVQARSHLEFITKPKEVTASRSPALTVTNKLIHLYGVWV